MPLFSRKISAYPEGYIGGFAQKNAEPGFYKLKILKLAQAITIGSKRLPLDQKVPSGTIQIDEQKESFSGGKLNDFKNFLNKEFSEKLTAKVIKINSKNQILSIEWKEQGLENVPEIEDNSNILSELGVYQSVDPSQIISEDGLEPKPLSISEDKFSMPKKDHLL